MKWTWVVVAVLPVALAGCGDPAAEAPITMEPGYYEVELPGLALAGFDVDQEKTPVKQLCLRPGDGDFFAHRVVRETITVPGCADPVNERQGNRLTTTIRCEVKEAEVKGDAFLRGNGRIRGDTFSAAFKFDMSELEISDPEARKDVRVLQAMQSVGSISITAKRIGDCPA